MPRNSLITGATLFIAMGAAIAGTIGTQYHGRTLVPAEVVDETTGAVAVIDFDIRYRFMLYKHKAWDATTGDEIANSYYHKDDFDCDEFFNELSAAFAFAIVGCVVSFIAMLLAFLRAASEKISRFFVAGAAMGAFIPLAIAFALSLTVYFQRQCGDDSFWEMGLFIGWGLSLLIGSTIMAFFGVILALVFEDTNLDKVRIIEVADM